MRTRFDKIESVGLFFLLLSFFFISCAGINKHEAAQRPAYKVALINAGAYSALYNQAQAEIGSYREMNLITGGELRQHLERYHKTPESLIHATSFAELTDVEGIDFALILLPAPPAYPSGSVGLKSVNWRRKTLKTETAVEAPRNPYDWLISANNGWVIIMSRPAGAHLSIDGKYAGTAPLLLMVEKDALKVQADWTKKESASHEANIAFEPRITVYASEKYLTRENKSGIYRKFQKLDETIGTGMVVALFVVVTVGGVVLLFLSPGIKK